MRPVTAKECGRIEKERRKRWGGPYAGELKFLECFWPPFIFRCGSCGSSFLTEGCPECSGTDEFEIRHSAGIPGAFCRGCGYAVHTWMCTSCGVENTLSGTLMLLD